MDLLAITGHHGHRQQSSHGVGPQPEIVGADLDDVADQLIARHKERTNA